MQKTAYEMRISDWSSDVCSADLLSPGEVNLERLCQADDIADRAIAGELDLREGFRLLRELGRPDTRREKIGSVASYGLSGASIAALFLHSSWVDLVVAAVIGLIIGGITLLAASRSEEHTSELQSLMRNSSAVFCLKKKTIETERQ